MSVKWHFARRPEMVFEQQVKSPDNIYLVGGKMLVVLGLLLGKPGYFNKEAL